MRLILAAFFLVAIVTVISMANAHAHAHGGGGGGEHRHHHHNHYHGDHPDTPEGMEAYMKLLNQKEDQLLKTDLFKEFDLSSSSSSSATKKKHDKMKMKLVTIRFSASEDDTGTESPTTRAEFACNAEVVSVQQLSSHKSPHGWYAVPSSSSSSSSSNVSSSSQYTKNARATALLRTLSPESLAEQHLAKDSVSESIPAEAPLHAIAFDLDASSENNKKSFVHLFRDPRFERLHAGHYEAPPTKAERDRAGESLPLPADHPAKACHERGDCSADRLHTKPKEVEFFWVPAAVDEVVLTCGVPRGGYYYDAAKKMQEAAMMKKAKTTTDAKSETESPPPKPSPVVATLPLRVLSETTQNEARQADAEALAEPELIRVREVGPPETTYSVVFLSGGYTQAEREMFIKNVTDIAAMLMDPGMDEAMTQDDEYSLANLHRTCPFNRYFGFWNVYAVFQASNDKGASRPLIGQVVDNNLQCVHPAEIERAVSCDRQRAAALTMVSPAPFATDPERVVIVSIVNTFIYGGSAVYIPGKMHFSNFFNGFSMDLIGDKERMLSLVDHEIGHALGNLMDEYSVGVPEPSGRSIRNCQVGNPGAPTGASLQWADWVSAALAAGAGFVSQYGNNLMKSPPWGVLSTPEAVCGFTNYFKSNPTCSLHRLNNFYFCPVCREQSTLQVFDSAVFVYDFPRFPFKDQVLLVSSAPSVMSINTTSTVVLHLNRLVHAKSGFSVAAFDTDNAPLPVVSTYSCPACVVLGPANFANYPAGVEQRIRVTVTDTTKNFVLPGNKGPHAKQLNQETFFRVVVVPDAAAVNDTTFYNYTTFRAFEADFGQVGVNESDGVPRYALCLAQNITFENRHLETPLQKNETFCSFNLSKSRGKYALPKGLAAFAASLDTWVPIVLGGMAIAFIALWMWASGKYTEMANGKIRPIFKTELSGFLSLVRLVMQGSAVVFLIASIVAIAVAAYVYYNTSMLGKILVIFGIVIAVILYIMAFIGFWAISSRSKKMLILNGIVLLVPLAIGMWLLISLNSLGSELQISKGWVAGLDALANTTAVSGSQPKQGGWMAKMEEFWVWMVANEPQWACNFEAMLECSGYYTACAGTLGSTATCPKGCDAVNERFSAPCQKLFKDYIVMHYSKAVTVVALCVALLGGGFLLNTLNFILLWQQKNAIIKGNQKRVQKVARDLGKPQLASQPNSKFTSMFLLRSLDKSDRAGLIREFKRIDADGSGELSKGELGLFIYKTMQHKPSPEEIQEIFDVTDLDGSGSISLREFLLLFGWDSTEMDAVRPPEQKRGMLHRVTSFARQKGAPTPAGYRGGGGGGGAAAAAGGAGMAAPLANRPGGGLARKPSRMANMSPEDIARQREEMRRRASQRFGDTGMFNGGGGGGAPPQAPPPPRGPPARAAHDDFDL